MKPKRYLILPVEGIRLSDTRSAAASPARELLSTLQPKNKAAVTSLGKKLSALIGKAKSPPAKKAAVKKGAAGARKAAAAAAAPGIEVIESLGEDSVKLVSASEEIVTALRQQNPGVRVVEEIFCRPALAPRVSIPVRPAVAVPAGAAHPAADTPVVVEVVRDDTGAPVRGADVIAFRSALDALQRKTNASGKATLPFAGTTTKLSRLFVYHEEPGVWGHFKTNVTVTGGAVQVRLAAIDLAAVDSLRHFHDIGTPSQGERVRVGVIDSGADTEHPDLVDAIEGGANCVPQSTRDADDFGPDGSHGTHVAGTIAARGTAPSGVRGIAPGAKLRIYRVFEKGNPGSGSSFAVIDAIERAIADKCDIINLSLGFDQGVTDDAISDALRKARNNGILAVAAAGNDGRQPVGFPGLDDNCVAVSAVGRRGTFPATATEVEDIQAPFGTDVNNFIAAFSNVGSALDACGAGVAVVSTVPGGYGAMSGTSMASPAVAGVAARLLSANATVRNMARNASRCDAIRKLLMDAAQSLGFGILFEGAGLPK